MKIFSPMTPIHNSPIHRLHPPKQDNSAKCTGDLRYYSLVSCDAINFSGGQLLSRQME